MNSSYSTSIPREPTSTGGMLMQRQLQANGNEAAVIAAQQFRADACPIRLSRPRVSTGELAQRALEILSDGQSFVALMEAAEEFSKLREEVQRDKIEGPAVWNVPVHDAVGELDLDQRFRFLQQDPDTGPVLLLAFSPQEVYDLNLIGARMARLTGRAVVVLSDGQTTDCRRAEISVVSNGSAIRPLLERPSPSPVTGDGSPEALGLTLIDHFITRRKWRGSELIALLDHVLAEFGHLTGRRYSSVEFPVGKMGAGKSACIILNPPCDPGAQKKQDGETPSEPSLILVLPRLLRPFPAGAVREAVASARNVIMVERGLPPRLARTLAEEVKVATGFDESGPAVVVRSFGDPEAASGKIDSPETEWAFLEALRSSAMPHA